ncbi:MAG: capsular biosynthesis protein, partial [Flavobacteriales bacterium]|nr:capsular biosynthesis protein [Flavobacteriales bacterium]
TYAASANIICHTGAKPIFVDSLPGEFNLDPAVVEAALSSQTKAVIPVDIGGYPANNQQLSEVISSASFQAANPAQELLGRPLLFSDAAHSFGATFHGKPACHYADISGYSFHAVKNLTTAEGGALAFNLPDQFDTDEVYAWFMRMSLHGQSKDALAKTQGGSWKYDIVDHGYKCNMTDLQAAIGLVELERYADDMLPRRKAICSAYHAGFANEEWYEAMPTASHKKSSNHLFMLRIKRSTEAQRDQIIDAIKGKGVAVNVHFPPLHRFTAFSSLGYSDVHFPNAVDAFSREISLPVYYDLTDASVQTVINAVKQSVKEILG